MKKLVSIILICLISLFTVISISGAETKYDVNITTIGNTQAISVGQEVTVKVSCDNITAEKGLATADIDLKYDSSILKYLSSKSSTVDGWTIEATEKTSNTINLFAVDESLGDHNVTASGKIFFTVTFKVLETTANSTEFLIANAESLDGNKSDVVGKKGSLTLNIKQTLPAPTNLVWDNGLAKWDAVDNADSYSIQIYKGNNEYKDPISTKATQYDFSNILTDGGSYCFTVIAISNSPNYKDSTESSKSSPYAVRGTLVSPKITLVSNYKDGGLTYQITDTNPKGTVSQYIVELYEKGSNTALVQVPKTSLSENIKIGDQTWKIVSGKEYEVSVTAKSSDTEINNDSSPSIRSASALAVSKIKSIAIKTQPKVEYFEGEKLDLSVMVITITFDDKTTKDVPFADFDKFDFTTSIENGKVLSLNDSRKQITVKFSSAIYATSSALTVSTNTCLHSTSHEDNASPTCGTNGYKKVVCDSCGMTLSETVIDATGEHQFGEWVVIYNPTAEVNGLKVRTCSVCNTTEQESIPKTGVTTNPDDSSSTTEVEATDEPIETDAETDPIIEDDGMNDLSRVFLIIVIVIFSLILIFIIGAVWLENRRSKARRQYNNRNMNNRRR